MTNLTAATQLDPIAYASRYVAMWNDTNAEHRDDTVAELWANDGEYFNALRAYRGHEGVATAVRLAHEKWAGEGFVFRPLSDATAHHDALKFRWEMVPAAGGEVQSIGVEFVILNADGLIRSDHQFIER